MAELREEPFRGSQWKAATFGVRNSGLKCSYWNPLNRSTCFASCSSQRSPLGSRCELYIEKIVELCNALLRITFLKGEFQQLFLLISKYSERLNIQNFNLELICRS